MLFRSRVILRGLRAVTDFEYEFQMAMMNRRMEPEIVTVFLMTSLRWVFLSSIILKEAAVHGGNIEGLVPEFVTRKSERNSGCCEERRCVSASSTARAGASAPP